MDNEELSTLMQEVSDELYLSARDQLIDWLITTYTQLSSEWTLERFIGQVQDTLGTVAVIEFLERIGVEGE